MIRLIVLFVSFWASRS